jgi:excisionase family DNA binding protein
MDTTDDILTVEEGAEYAKIAPKTLRKWLKSGQLPGLRAGRHWRVEKSALQQFLREQAQKAVTRPEPQPPRPVLVPDDSEEGA